LILSEKISIALKRFNTKRQTIRSGFENRPVAPMQEITEAMIQ